MTGFIYSCLIGNTPCSFFVCRKPRVRGVRIRIDQSGACIVTINQTCEMKEMERLLHRHRGWFVQRIEALKKRGLSLKPFDPHAQRQGYVAYKEHARRLVAKRLPELNAQYDFSFERVSIKNLRSKWASCSSKGNLNFHYQIVFLPDALVDYLIVHELCHLREQNHSARFWALVGQTVPDWKVKRRELRQWHLPSVS